MNKHDSYLFHAVHIRKIERGKNMLLQVTFCLLEKTPTPAENQQAQKREKQPNVSAIYPWIIPS